MFLSPRFPRIHDDAGTGEAIEVGLKDLAERLERIEERIVNVGGRVAEVHEKQVWANIKSINIDHKLETIVGRITAVEDQIRVTRSLKVSRSSEFHTV